MEAKTTITPAQLRAARGLISWSQKDLAERSNVARSMIAGFESCKRKPNLANRTGLRRALEAAGVIFVEENGEGPGVRLRKGNDYHRRAAKGGPRAGGSEALS
jgi:transcriptional regulator with XRE-family HTH domain